MAALLTRFRSRAAAVVFGALIATSGCSLSTDNGGPVFQFVFTQPGNQAPDASDVADIEVLGRTGYIEAIGGILLMPCLTADRTASYQREGTTLTFRIITRPNNGACSSGPTQPIGYNAYLTNVEPGTYTVRIVHEGDQLVPSGTVVKEVVVTVV